MSLHIKTLKTIKISRVCMSTRSRSPPPVPTLRVQNNQEQLEYEIIAQSI